MACRRARPWLAAGVLAGVLAACSSGSDPDKAADPAPSTAAGGSAGATAGVGEPAEPTADPAGRSFTVAATGDVLIHPPLTAQAAADARAGGRDGYDFGPLFAGVKPVIAGADLAICHLEVPFGRPEGPFRGYPTFEAPPQVATALKATGYDTCSTASNHTLDRGAGGVQRTLDALDAAGIRHTGSARSSREAATPTVLTVAGVKVAQLSYTFGFNGLTLPAAKPWLSNPIDEDRILTEARRARAAGAEVVVLSMHWGTEFQHRPTAEQRSLARRLLGSPHIDLIVGHHAHVTQPFERVGGEWVAYGLGNHVARHAEPRGSTEETLIARFTFTERAGRWRVTKAEYVPALVDLGPPIRLVNLTTALADPALAAGARARYQAARDRIRSVAVSRGGTGAGLVPAAP